MAALRALRRQLEVFGQQGLLDADARTQLNLAINEQEQRLLLCCAGGGRSAGGRRRSDCDN